MSNNNHQELVVKMYNNLFYDYFGNPLFEYVHFWQEYPKKNHLRGYFRIQTDDQRIAQVIRKRQKSSECKVYMDNFYLFQIEFCNKKTGVNSFNRLLERYNYPKAKYNAKSGLFVSSQGNNRDIKTKVRVS